ncbi:MAG: SIMPL domain-containing protein [Bryobacteraceae bacterium]
MRTTPLVFSALIVCSAVAQAQTPSPRYIRAFGEGVVSVKPDLARVQFSVVTQAPNASDAANQNATQVNTVLTALRSLLGPSADIHTLSYSLTANYSFPQNSQPVLTGYTANNTVEVVLSDLSLIGRVIDTGVQAGANRVQGLQFTVKDEQPARTQALRLATAQAKTHAEAMAAGVSVRVGAPISIEEGTSVRPFNTDLRAATSAATTPIETGVVEVRANVTLQLEILP